MNNVLEVNNLSKIFKDFSINSISFNLPAGVIMGFVGQNGAGKTTTIRLLIISAIISYGIFKNSEL